MKANLIFAGMLVLAVWGGLALLGAALTSERYGIIVRTLNS